MYDYFGAVVDILTQAKYAREEVIAISKRGNEPGFDTTFLTALKESEGYLACGITIAKNFEPSSITLISSGAKKLDETLTILLGD